MITIGLPTLNSEKRISGMLDSLLGQTHGDFKVLISDNASTDGTNELCMEYASRDGRIAVHRQPERLCMRDNFRYVLEKADTEFFSWQQDDDLMDREWLEETHRELQERPDIALSFTDSRYVKDGLEKDMKRCYELSDDRRARIRHLMTDNRFKIWFFVGFDGLWRTERLKETFLPLIDTYQHETLLGTDMLLLFNAEIHRSYSFINKRLFTKRLFTDQQTYRTDYSYGERYAEAQGMITQGMQYMNEIIDQADFNEQDKRSLRRLAKQIVEETVSNASWLRRLKWRLLPWYRKKAKSSSLES